MTDFHARLAGLAVQEDIQAMTVGFGEEPDGDGWTILISGGIPHEELPDDVELFDNGEYTICISDAAVAEACVLKWKVEAGKLSLLLSPDGAADLGVDEELLIFFPAESTAMVEKSLAKIFVMYSDLPAPVAWRDA